MRLTAGVNGIKVFMAVSHAFCIKLECLLLASHSIQSSLLFLGKASSQPSVEHLKGVG